MRETNRSLRVGVIGTGRLGRNHARVYASLDEIDSLAVYDRDVVRAHEVGERYGATVCESVESLLAGCDAVSICTPATKHAESASMAFRRGVHVLVEKPIASRTGEAVDMVRSARERGCVFQVGHIERFNGAFEAARALLKAPRFIESHRLATFTPRGTDVSVVLDLMIHDIDLVLSVLGGKQITDLRASGTGVLTDSPDIVNARLEFEGGCVANITASRISRDPLRKIRFFQENMYISADLREKSVEAFEKSPDVSLEALTRDPTAFIRRVPVDVDGTEPLLKEIAAFIAAVRGGAEPLVTGEQGLEALRIAEEVQRTIGECRERA
ncbi:MAG TPA: Gfo/Idh/MocA family oxidoreductase [Patescibacteria group bacterium]|nr:Gfo/Idh/MocA family oxidoreductase [Patescibacteria group bacterium]